MFVVVAVSTTLFLAADFLQTRISISSPFYVLNFFSGMTNPIPPILFRFLPSPADIIERVMGWGVLFLLIRRSYISVRRSSFKPPANFDGILVGAASIGVVGVVLGMWLG